MNEIHREIILRNGIFKTMDTLKKKVAHLYRASMIIYISAPGNNFPFPKNLSAPAENWSP